MKKVYILIDGKRYAVNAEIIEYYNGFIRMKMFNTCCPNCGTDNCWIKAEEIGGAK